MILFCFKKEPIKQINSSQFIHYGSGNISCSVVSNSLQPHGLQPTRFLCPWNSPGQNTGVGCHSLLQGIFPTQGSKPGFMHCSQIHYYLSHWGSPYENIHSFLNMLLAIGSASLYFSLLQNLAAQTSIHVSTNRILYLTLFIPGYSAPSPTLSVVYVPKARQNL